MNMPPEADIAVAIAKLDLVTSDLSDLKMSMRELTSAVSRLAVIEERQSATNESIGRAFKQIDGLSVRVGTLEVAQPIQKQSSDYVQKAVGYIIAIVLGAVIAGVMRSQPHGAEATPPAVTSK